MRVVVLANRASGTRASARKRAHAVSQAFADTGLHPEVRFLAGAQVQDAARQAVAEGADAVVAAGGDGTVSAVAGAVAGSRSALGVLPLGTLNHFARDAGLPAVVAEAAGVVAAGHARQVDVAEVNGRVFVNNSSIGMYPSAVREREGRGGPKRLATAAAALAVLRRLPSHRVTLTVDGHPERRTTPCVFVGNNPYETAFGRLGRRASLDTGRLGLCTVRGTSRRAVLALAARALAGRLDTARDLELQEAESITIASAHRHAIRVALDGEVARLALPLRYRIRPRALRLLVPRPP
ncbi:MAG TPA: diacylglycerol kinase family protein [Candidatus Thermoplasmatota archaeon]|nr:diacylglycerol kinase family protein [Candidatus Thermoplasmatota archaeon]